MNNYKKEIHIGDRSVGIGQPTYIIAEVGSNHNGSLDEAKMLIKALADAGADAVKFQLFKADLLYTKADKRYEGTIPFETPREWLPELMEISKKYNIDFSASPFDFEAVDLLEANNCPFIKIASPEVRDYSLLKYSAKKGIPIILSTGVCEISDVGLAVNAIESTKICDLVILHCSSVYPSSSTDMNLRVIENFSKLFPHPIGLSDHSMSIVYPSIAVALGACVIEKHVTFDQLGKSPDSPISISIEDFKSMVNLIRETELALGSPYKKILKDRERPDLHQKSIVSKISISKGESLSPEKLIIKRAQGGLSPFLMDEISNYFAQIDIATDEIITFKHIKNTR